MLMTSSVKKESTGDFKERENNKVDLAYFFLLPKLSLPFLDKICLLTFCVCLFYFGDQKPGKGSDLFILPPQQWPS